MATDEEVITIPKKTYQSLLRAAHFLDCLNALGIDNWEGYQDACDMHDEDFTD